MVVEAVVLLRVDAHLPERPGPFFGPVGAICALNARSCECMASSFSLLARFLSFSVRKIPRCAAVDGADGPDPDDNLEDNGLVMLPRGWAMIATDITA